MFTNFLMSLMLVVGGSDNAPPAADPAEMIGQMQTLRDAMAKLELQRVQLEKDLAAMQTRWAALSEPAVAVKRVDSVVEPAPAPLSIRIGSAEFTPGGYADMMGLFRSTNLGSGVSTSFGSIPYSNTPQGRLTETRFSGQTSRISMKIASTYGKTDVLGYVEADFNGAQPANGMVSSNSNPLRLRLYFVDARHGGWEVLGGQAWSLLTPNRNGISPMPSDVFLGTTVDSVYVAGLTWTRSPQFRVVRHWNPRWTTAVSLENPDQFVGTAVTLPSGNYSGQVDSGASAATPSYYPDIITKTAYDGLLGRRALHVEAAALLSGFRVVNAGNQRLQRSGGGGSVNVNFELVKNFRLIANSFYSSGGGRYLYGLGPDLVIRPDGTPSLIRAASGVGGFEYQASPSWLIAAYESGAYFGRSYTGAIGYGYPGSSTAANRAIEESTLSVTRTLWKRKDLGALQVITQYSYLWRTPWFVAAGAPPNAHSHMIFADLRYTLP